MANLRAGSTIGGSPLVSKDDLLDVIRDYLDDVSIIPLGYTYIQFPDRPTPAVLFGGTWTALFDNEGIFFRTPGGEASSFGGGIQEDAIRNITGEFRVTGNIFRGTSGGAFSSESWNSKHSVKGDNKSSYNGHIGLFDASRVVPTAEENRPRNRTVRVWLKTAN